MSVYLDASVIVALFLDDPFSLRAVTAFHGNRSDLVVSDFAAAEFASAAARLVRMGQLTTTEAETAFADLDSWLGSKIERAEVAPADVKAAQGYLRTLAYTLRTPDSLHIAMAQRLGAELATFDIRLGEIARRLSVSVASI